MHLQWIDGNLLLAKNDKTPSDFHLKGFLYLGPESNRHECYLIGV